MIIMHEKTKAKYSISKITKNVEKERTYLNFTPTPNKRTAENAKRLKQEIKKDLMEKKNLNHHTENTLCLLGTHTLIFRIQTTGSDQTSKMKQKGY